jgi:aspartyl-tRNA(Asn)/glutamyl-tRNA(Gln) amidotransferase subunit C
MKVTEKDVDYVSDLANLELSKDERTRMLLDLNSILQHIARLGELDTSAVAPMAQVSERYAAGESRQGIDGFPIATRDDVKDGLRKSLPHHVAIKNAPDSDGTFFEVPKVIER